MEIDETNNEPAIEIQPKDESYPMIHDDVLYDSLSDYPSYEVHGEIYEKEPTVMDTISETTHDVMADIGSFTKHHRTMIACLIPVIIISLVLMHNIYTKTHGCAKKYDNVCDGKITSLEMLKITTCLLDVAAISYLISVLLF